MCVHAQDRSAPARVRCPDTQLPVARPENRRGVWGNGNQIDNNLPRNKFRQVNLSLEEALKIPGLVLTWESTSTSLGRIYGHTAITAGDGHTSYSDFIEHYTTNSGRSGFKVLAPT